MTDSEIRTLRALEATMVKAGQVAREAVQKYKAEHLAAVPFSPAWEEARRMKSWAEGRLLAHVTDLNDLREAFSDELIAENKNRQCDHAWVPWYNADDEIDGLACFLCGEHKRDVHPLGCTCPDCEDGRGDRDYHARKEEV